MKSIECINFVSHNAPNILLIADIDNNYTQGFHLKHFKNSHNIYVVYHELNDNFKFYNDLPSKHDYIKQELDKDNLKEFIISTISFGSFLAFYLIFYFPNRVKRAVIHDYYLNSHHTYNKLWNASLHFDTSNWNIPNKSNTPILFMLHRDNYVTKADIKEINSIFTNVQYTFFPCGHNIHYHFKLGKRIWFYLFNGISLKYFWNNYLINFVKNNKIKKRNPLKLKFFILYLKKQLKKS